MNYLKDYGSICISFNDILYAIEEGVKRYLINEKLNHFVYSFNSADKKIGKIIITNDSITIDLSKLKEYICNYFNLKNNETLINQIDELKKKMKENPNHFKTISKDINDDFKKSKKNDRGNYKTKSKKDKVCSERFNNTCISNLSKFKNFLNYYEDYSNVNIKVLNQKKLDLIIAYKIMNKTKQSKKETIEYKKGLELLVSYVKDNIELLKENFSVNRYKIIDIYNYLKVENIKQNNHKSNVVNFNYSFFEGEVKESKEYLRRLGGSIHDVDDDKLRNLLKKKLELYNSLDYKKVYIGTDSFYGYIGFVLNNNYVILDKLYKSNDKIAKDNAIYIVKEDDFEDITKMKKSELINKIDEGIINAKRIIHNDNFVNNTKKYIKRLDILNYLYGRNYCND